MKHTKILSAVFGLLAVLLLVGTAFLAVSSRNAAPVLPESMKHAEAQTRELMEAICSGDYAAAEKLIIGGPDLAALQEPSNALSKYLWEVYIDSLSYSFEGSCYADDYGVYRDVTVTMADIPAIMRDLQSHSAILLAGKAAADPDNAYNADGSYRREFIMEALAEEAAALELSTYQTTRTLTLQLDGKGGTWAVRADRALLDLLAGGMGGT